MLSSTFASVWGDVCIFGSSKSWAYHENIYCNYQCTTEINKILNVIILDPVLSIVILNMAYPYKHSMFANNQLFMISTGPLDTVPDIYYIKNLNINFTKEALQQTKEPYLPIIMDTVAILAFPIIIISMFLKFPFITWIYLFL